MASLAKNPNNEIWICSRGSKSSLNPNIHYLKWDGTKIPYSGESWDVIINLAGNGIADKKWTSAHKAEILKSRLDASNACVELMHTMERKPSVFIAGSAVGFYGADRPNEILDESGSAGSDFLASVCTQWEAASEIKEVRTVNIRTGVILGIGGGAWSQIYTPFKFFVGGVIGSGLQGFPWMHVDDWVKAVEFCIENPKMEGPVILTAPSHIDMKHFVEAISKGSGKPSLFYIPEFAIKLAMGESSVMVLGGLKLRPKKLIEAGFEWKFPEPVSAVKALTSV